MSTSVSSASAHATTKAASADEAQAIAQEAYIFLYPLVIMDLTRKQMINLDPKVSIAATPVNTFNHVREIPASRY